MEISSSSFLNLSSGVYLHQPTKNQPYRTFRSLAISLSVFVLVLQIACHIWHIWICKLQIRKSFRIATSHRKNHENRWRNGVYTPNASPENSLCIAQLHVCAHTQLHSMPIWCIQHRFCYISVSSPPIHMIPSAFGSYLKHLLTVQLVWQDAY